MPAQRQTLEPMEHYAAKHAGLVPARFAPCATCGARLDLTCTEEVRRREQHKEGCMWAL